MFQRLVHKACLIVDLSSIMKTNMFQDRLSNWSYNTLEPYYDEMCFGTSSQSWPYNTLEVHHEKMRLIMKKRFYGTCSQNLSYSTLNRITKKKKAERRIFETVSQSWPYIRLDSINFLLLGQFKQSWPYYCNRLKPHHEIQLPQFWITYQIPIICNLNKRSIQFIHNNKTTTITAI